MSIATDSAVQTLLKSYESLTGTCKVLQQTCEALHARLALVEVQLAELKKPADEPPLLPKNADAKRSKSA